MGEAGRIEKAREILGWGMVQRCRAEVRRPRDAGELEALLAEARRRGLRVGLRGSGMSYGDASLADGALLLELGEMNRLLDWDPETGVLRAEPGLRLHDVWRHVLAAGWWPPVVSGTQFTSLGGAVAMNIHGKNGVQVGPIGDHVRAFVAKTCTDLPRDGIDWVHYEDVFSIQSG